MLTAYSIRPRKSASTGLLLLLALAAVCLVLTSQALAQTDYGDQPPQSSAPPAPPSKTPPPVEDEPVTTLSVDVNVVNLFFNVRDRHNGLIGGLGRQDFEIYEDGKPQTAKFFNREADQPLTLGLLIDTSGSQANVLPMTREIGAAFLRDVLRAKDMAFLIGFDVNVDLLQDYTNSVSRLRSALQNTRVNSGWGSSGLPGLGGGPIPTSNPRGTLLYDAVYLAANEKLRRETGRKAVIILTDGEDQGSRVKIHDAIEAAQKADTIVYVILEADRGYPSGDSEMRKLCTETGGRVIDVGNNYDKLNKAFRQISEELRTQYNLGYTPTNAKRDGTFRKVEIKAANSDYKVQSRKGYYAKKAGSDD